NGKNDKISVFFFCKEFLNNVLLMVNLDFVVLSADVPRNGLLYRRLFARSRISYDTFSSYHLEEGQFLLIDLRGDEPQLKKLTVTPDFL
ncbi:MAG: hypothetical protein ACYCOU_09925, partial [Sulfobacillus sp.]